MSDSKPLKTPRPTVVFFYFITSIFLYAGLCFLADCNGCKPQTRQEDLQLQILPPSPVFFSIFTQRGWLFSPRRRHSTPGPRSSACCSCTEQVSRQQPRRKTTTAASARSTCSWDLLSTSPPGRAARSHSGSGLADCDTGNYEAENIQKI